MAFKEMKPLNSVPDSPEKLFLDLPRRKIPGVLPHQQELMKTYASECINEPDVALQLPTGSGKTLVGLLIGEWRRKKFDEKVVYLVPTKQLVNQVVEQAKDKYGLNVEGFTGPSKDYSKITKANYKSAANIAITTYSSLFNNNPFFNDADVIILDDVHTAENYISALWTVKIERTTAEHAALHAALCVLLKPLIDPLNYTRLRGEVNDITGGTWVDKLSTPDFFAITNEISEILDAHTKGTDLAYSWSMIRDNIKSCHFYFSSQEILIRPLIPPTWTHDAFSKPKQRIYMSATLGAGGDMERLVGRGPIKRLPVPDGMDKHGVGRRFFIFPEMTLSTDGEKKLRYDLMEQTQRSLFLVPNTKLRDEIETDIIDNLGYGVFSATDIQETKASFLEAESAAVVMANRYDGVDFPGDDCRLMFIEGLPRATNIQEKFLMSRMGANALFNERIQTRVLQAIGRCTRSLEDYSAVVVSGEELPDYLADKKRCKYFHPELQAEIKFGIEQSMGATTKDVIDNLKIFLDNGQEWEKASQQIVAYRKDMTQEPFPALSELQNVVIDEISYQKNIWQKDYEAALVSADKILSVIKDPELRGYRALWHYLAGSAAWLDVNSGGNESLTKRAQDEFIRAKEAAPQVSWLVPLSRYTGKSKDENEIIDEMILEQVERIETVLSSLGSSYERKYSEREKDILGGLLSDDTKKFENAHKLLGEMLGFESDNKETDGSPDPWWISSNICLVFEDHSGANTESSLDVTKARQVSLHPKWIRDNVPSASKANIFPVLITPVKNVKIAAVSFLDDVLLWNLNDFQEWAKGALAVIRKLRTTFTEPGDLIWRDSAVKELKHNNFDANSIVNTLKKNKAKAILNPVK